MMAMPDRPTTGARHVFAEPPKLDPEDVARKLAAAPGLRMAPATEFEIGPDGRIVGFEREGMTFQRKVRNYFAGVFYNIFVTYIPSHFIRLGYLRLCGAVIGKDSSILRGTTVMDPEFLTIGEGTAVGNRCLLDARGGIYIGNNVTIASDVHIVAGGHDMNHPDFPAYVVPTVIEDYAWIASRAMILPSFIGRGAVIGAQTVVVKDVAELDVVGGIPPKVIARRNPDALQYRSKHRPLFG
jgi:acetyltransferase-like isoleucine patch superfamily enzyme